MLGALLAAALAVRLLAIAADAAFGVLSQPPIAPFHHGRAAALAAAWLDGRFGVPLGQLTTGLKITPMRVLVAHLLAPFYIVLAPIADGPVVGRIAVAVLSLSLGVLAYAFARAVDLSARPALTTAGVVLFWPGIVYRSVVIQREVVVAAAMLAAVWAAARWTRAPVRDLRRVGEAAVLAVALGLLIVLRPENLLVLAVVFVVAAVVRMGLRARTLVPVGTVAVVGGGVAVTQLGTFIGRRATAVTPRLIDAYAHARAHGDAAYLTWLHYNSWLDIAAFVPLKVVYLLGSPLPWRVDGPAALLAGASGWLLVAMTALAGYGGASALRDDRRLAGGVDHRSVAVLAAFLVVGITAYAIIEMNGGAAFRRRIVFVPALAVLAVVGARHAQRALAQRTRAPRTSRA